MLKFIPLSVLQSIRELAFNRSPLNPHDLIILQQLCVKADYNPNPTYVFICRSDGQDERERAVRRRQSNHCNWEQLWQL